MVRADLVTSIVLLALGLAAIVESWRMPRFEDVGSDVWSAPGVVPGLVGAALNLTAAILFVRSIVALGRPAESSAPAGAKPDSFDPTGSAPAAQVGWGRAALAAGLCITYAAGLVGRMPFWVATFLFVLAFVTAFDLLGDGPRRSLGRILVVAGLVAAGAAIVVPYVFETIFLVRLP